MNKHTSQVIDSVSTSELMKALTTLQNLSKQQDKAEISFCKFQQPDNATSIDFQTYMAAQTNSQNFNKHASKKSISPLKQTHQDNTYSKVSSMKSRSHSPFEKRSERTDSRVSKYSKYTVKHSQKQNKKKEELNRKYSQYPSFQSKKILEQKHREGVNYIPIQYRAEELLKQKQAKLAKLQKQKEISKIMEEKECTFHPNIIKNYKKPNNIRQDYHKPRVTEADMHKFDQCFIDNQFLCPSTQPYVRQESASSEYQMLQGKGRVINHNEETKVVRKKYKNEKFNFLLDLIH